VHLLVDHRERSSSLFQEISNSSCHYEVTSLRVGDYIVDGRVVVERKTIDDLQRSILDTRVFRQANEMNKSRYQPVMLLEGPLRIRRIGRAKIQGALVSIAVVFQIPILRTRDGVESLWTLEAISRQASVTNVRSAARRRFRGKATPDGAQLEVLRAIPGVGLARARALISVFGSLRDIAMASEPELAAVDGIGVTTAKRIRALLDRKHSRRPQGQT